VSAPHHCAIANEEEYLGVTEPQRLALHAAARAALGEQEGDTLMALSPPANTDIATRQDVEHAQALMQADIEHAQALLKADIELSVAELRGEILRRLDVVQWRVIAAFIVTITVATLLG
jgi:hypothetical protein